MHSCLCWVFLAAWAFLELWQAGVLSSCGVRASHRSGFSCCGAQALGRVGSSLWHMGSVEPGSIAVAHGLSGSSSEIFPDQGWNPCLLHRQVDSSPLSHQRWATFYNQRKSGERENLSFLRRCHASIISSSSRLSKDFARSHVVKLGPQVAVFWAEIVFEGALTY